MIAISPSRFFIVVPLHSPYMLVALGVAWLSGVVVLLIDPSNGPRALGPLALLQMFAASSGFAVAARRGHLDLLLTSGAGRSYIAVTHLGLSVLPGMIAWAGLAVVEMLVRGTLAPSALASGTIVAWGLISTLAWSLTVWLPRLSGGIAWLLAIAAWLVGWSEGANAIAAVQHEAVGYAARALVIAFCPFVLLGQSVQGDQALAAIPATAFATLFAAFAVTRIVRMDVPLESTQ
jgi:hypothetical protein